MEHSLLSLTFIAGFFTIIGAVVGASISYIFAIKFFKYQLNLTEKLKFRSSILNQFSSIFPSATNSPTHIEKFLKEAFIATKKASDNLRPHLNFNELHRFDLALNKFENDLFSEILYHLKLENRLYAESHGNKKGDIKIAEKILKEDIEAILEFTK